MKKIIFALLAAGLLFGSSCKKCGYCVDSGGNHSSATCSSSGLVSAVGGDPYKQAQADCNAQQGSRWVVE